MSYCEDTDLIVGDIGGLDALKAQFIVAAGNEMDSMLGFVYLLPLSGISTHVTLLLKTICLKLASGRLLMAQAAGSEDAVVHAYGKSLVDEAMRDLYAIRNMQIDLGAPKVTSMQATGNAPAIHQGDDTSGVDTFYRIMGASTYGDAPSGWRPGSW